MLLRNLTTQMCTTESKCFYIAFTWMMKTFTFSIDLPQYLRTIQANPLFKQNMQSTFNSGNFALRQRFTYRIFTKCVHFPHRDSKHPTVRGMAEFPMSQRLGCTPWEWDLFVFSHDITIVLLWQRSH